jgi:hypothetical protein
MPTPPCAWRWQKGIDVADVRRFAEGTEVSAERSRAELETLLQKHGAKEFAVYTSEPRTVFMYKLRGVMVRHVVEYPEAKPYLKDPRASWKQRPAEQVKKLQEAEWRRRWRALVLVCKAKLEIIESGGSTFEREFMADMVLGDGRTVAQVLIPQMQNLSSGEMPDFSRLLLGPGGDNG